MTVNIDDIKSRFRVSEVVGRYVSLKKAGHEFEGLCPFHADKSPSLRVNDAKGFWHCFGCGEHGDALDFVVKSENVSLPVAAEIISGERQSDGPKYTPPPANDTPDDADRFRVIMPVPDDAPAFRVDDDRVAFYSYKKQKPVTRQPAAVYEYRNEAGELLGYVARIEWEKDGKRHKITPTITFCESDDGVRQWVDRAFPEPRPLYGLDELTAKPAKAVLCVEGEKSADAARRLFPANPVVSWPMGTNSVGKAEWSTLKGRKVVFWPDADAQRYPDGHDLAGELKPLHEQPGTKAMIEAASYLEGIADALILEPPSDVSGGWDAADAETEWGAERAQEWLKSAISEANRKRVAALPADTAPADDAPPMPEYDGPPDDDGPAYDDEPYRAPFRILGHDRGTFYYLPRGSRQVIELTAPAHTKLNMFQLASPQYWDSAFPTKKGCDWDSAAFALMKQAYERGVFNRTRRRRGRGAWIDNGRNIYHLGDRLWVDGAIVEIDEIETVFVYEQADAMDLDLSHELNTKAAYQALDIARAFSWGADLHAYLLAGWCVIAPVCGVLDWRPHFWMTGPSGAGKSTIMRDYVGQLVGPTAFIAEGGTTEAAIRQSLDGDARPVLFDEAEPKDQSARQKIQSVLDLARVSSSESGGEIVKGGSNHKAQTFRVRSCFGFASINPGVEFYADETRITRLPLLKPNPGEGEDEKEMRQAAWEQLAERLAATITREFAEGLLARTVRNLGTLQENARTFSKAAAMMFGSARHGQQYGPMLAGAYLLHSTKLISYEDAIKWLRDKKFSDVVSDSAGDSDDIRCVSHIMQARIRATLEQGRVEDYSVAEILEFIDHCHSIADETLAKRAEGYLRRHGLKYEDGGLWVANAHNELARIFRDTPWGSGWKETLGGVAGAIRSTQPVYFSRFDRQRATFIPQESLG